MVFLAIHDVRNDIQKNSKIALPTDDFVFVFELYVAAFFLCVDIYEVDMYQRKIIEKFRERLG